MKAFADLADLPEDERIRIAAETALAGNIVGVAVDDEAEKIARYTRKLLARGVRIIDTTTPDEVAQALISAVNADDALLDKIAKAEAK